MDELLPESTAQRLHRALFGAYPDALLLVDAAGRIVMANPAAGVLLGYADGELAGMPVDALVPDAIRPRHAAWRHDYSKNPLPRAMGTQMELVARRKDASEVMVEIALSPLLDEGVPYVVAAVRGIAAYPRVQQVLQRARYSEAVAAMGQLAVDTRDPEQLLRDVPGRAIETLGVDAAVVSLLEPNRLEFRIASAAGVLGAAGLVGQRVANRSDTAPGFVVAQGGPQRVTDARQERRFSVPPAWLAQGIVSALAVPVSDRGQTIGVLAVHSRRAQTFGDDEVRFLQSLANLMVTSMQRARSEEALSHAQRLESVGQLTGGIAHDFNNLLTVIQGNLQVLEQHPAIAADDVSLQMLGAAARASRRGAELTGKLLAFSRRQVLSPRAIDVGALLESLADMLRRTLDQHVRIEVAVGSSATCLADPGQLESALLNLAINARDAMPDGGTLSFACRLCTDLPPELTEPGGPAYVAIDVRDTGVGMSEAVRERAFEPFFTTKEAGRGTGLGLSTVYGFVKQSHGAVQLHSVPGDGTTVTLLLPCAPAAPAPASARARAQPALARGLRVLLVEDDPEVRGVVQGFLASMGCRVTVCASAPEALAQLGDAGRHQLLLSDVALGTGMRGTELARLVGERSPGIAMLLMSGFSVELLQASGAGPLAPELLRKPFDRSTLEQALARALAAVRPG